MAAFFVVVFLPAFLAAFFFVVFLPALFFAGSMWLIYLALDGDTRDVDGPPTAIVRLEPAGRR